MLNKIKKSVLDPQAVEDVVVGFDNVVIQWYPKYTKAKMKINLKQINDGNSSFNLHMPVKLSRYICEIIP